MLLLVVTLLGFEEKTKTWSPLEFSRKRKRKMLSWMIIITKYYDFDFQIWRTAAIMPPSNLKHFLVKAVNLFKFKKRQNYRILFTFFAWICFVLLLNGPLRSNTNEEREIFRSKNLLTAKTKSEERNLSEAFSIEEQSSSPPSSDDEQNRRQKRLQYECQSRQFLSKSLQQSGNNSIKLFTNLYILLFFHKDSFFPLKFDFFLLNTINLSKQLDLIYLLFVFFSPEKKLAFEKFAMIFWNLKQMRKIYLTIHNCIFFW